MRVLVLLRQTLRRGGEGGQLSQQLLKQAPPQGTLQQRLAHGTAASAPAAAAASGAPTAAQQLGIARMQALVGASGQVSQRASGACSSSSAASGWASRVAPHHCTHWPSASAACSFGSRAKGRASALELSSAAPGACSTSASSRQALTDVQPVLLSRAVSRAGGCGSGGRAQARLARRDCTIGGARAPSPPRLSPAKRHAHAVMSERARALCHRRRNLAGGDGGHPLEVVDEQSSTAPPVASSGAAAREPAGPAGRGAADASRGRGGSHR